MKNNIQALNITPETSDTWIKRNSDRIVSRIVNVTPELAQKWLEKNVNNRKMNHSDVDRYAENMRNGKWTLGVDAIAFDSKGNLMNGQHRLAAVVKSGTTQQFNVMVGIENNINIDRQRVRSKLDNFRLFSDFDKKFISNITISTFSFLMDCLGFDSKNTEELMDFMNYYEEEIKDFFTNYEYLSKIAKLKSNRRSGMLAALFLAYLNGVDMTTINNIVKVHITGEYVIEGYDINKFLPVIKLNKKIEGYGKEGSSLRTELFLRTLFCIDQVVNNKSAKTNHMMYSMPYDLEYNGKHLRREISNNRYLSAETRQKLKKSMKKMGINSVEEQKVIVA